MRLISRVAVQLILSAICVQTDPLESPTTLLPLSFNPLPLGSIKPNGWLHNELRISAAGLAGHEWDFYRYVKDSPWLGGTDEYSPLNEAFPYWFNGLVPLAYSLDDERLKSQVHGAARIILERQQDDGWIGPEVVNKRTFWGRYPVFLGLVNLVDANSTWEEPVLRAWGGFNGLMNQMLRNEWEGLKKTAESEISEGDFGWGRVRDADMLIALMWLLEKHPIGQERVILENLNFMNNGSLDWREWYTDERYPKDPLVGDVPEDDFPFTHGVNVGQGLKTAAAVRRFTQDESLVESAVRAVNWTYTYHGAASGAIIADERLQGLAPWSGSELCMQVEAMYSLTYLYQALGIGYFADRAELTTFNAMPAQLTPDWWGHQYVEQANQPWARIEDEVPFWNVGGSGTVFGLEPNYPCCTVNHPQGLPKFLMATYATTADGNGLVAAQLSPASVDTVLNSGRVKADCQTTYPFGSVLTYTFDSEGPFDFYVRIPSWTTSRSSIQLNSESPSDLSPDATSQLHKISLPAGSSTVKLSLKSDITTQPRANDTVSVFHGALMYALPVSASTTSSVPLQFNSPDPVSNTPAQSRDFYYTNTSAWNYAIDPSTLKLTWDAEDGAELPNPIFAPGAPPVGIEVDACLIEWGLYKGAPGSPPLGEERKCIAEKERVRLVPYGSAKTRMSELPVIDL